MYSSSDAETEERNKLQDALDCLKTVQQENSVLKALMQRCQDHHRAFSKAACEGKSVAWAEGKYLSMAGTGVNEPTEQLGCQKLQPGHVPQTSSVAAQFQVDVKPLVKAESTETHKSKRQIVKKAFDQVFLIWMASNGERKHKNSIRLALAPALPSMISGAASFKAKFSDLGVEIPSDIVNKLNSGPNARSVKVHELASLTAWQVIETSNSDELEYLVFLTRQAIDEKEPSASAFHSLFWAIFATFADKVKCSTKDLRDDIKVKKATGDTPVAEAVVTTSETAWINAKKIDTATIDNSKLADTWILHSEEAKDVKLEEAKTPSFQYKTALYIYDAPEVYPACPQQLPRNSRVFPEYFSGDPTGFPRN
ncbi:hypothetical protein HDU77_010075 [Chytriomyces hyalinus]|nr:hypothetical protein HDU77_010075 [Chytriomyces hyalinus]